MSLGAAGDYAGRAVQREKECSSRERSHGRGLTACGLGKGTCVGTVQTASEAAGAGFRDTESPETGSGEIFEADDQSEEVELTVRATRTRWKRS